MNGKTLGKIGPVARTSTAWKHGVKRAVKRAEKRDWRREAHAER